MRTPMKKEISLEGKVALITGGATGLGLAIAQEMADVGATIVIMGRRKEKLEEAKQLLPGVHCYQGDVTDYAAIPALVEQIEKEVGPIDILVNNAGIQNRKPFFDYTPDEIQAIFDTHMKGSFVMSQECGKKMKERGKGVILMITSLSAVGGMVMLQPYTMAKSALMALTRSLTQELSPYGIRVNSVNPGFVETEMLIKANAKEPGRRERILSKTPMGRFALPKEIGMAAAFLASDAASFITGVDLRVDGGTSNTLLPS